MKRFYIAILFFMLPIIVFMGGTEWYVRSLPNMYKYKNERMDLLAEKVEILSFGSSHGMNGINPAYLDGAAFNLGFPSQSLKYDYFLLRKWENRYKKLKTVIVPVDYFTFFFDEPFGGDYTPRYYKIYLDCPYHRGFSFYSLEMFAFRALHGKIVTLRENNWHPMSDEYGFLNLNDGLSPKEEGWDNQFDARKLVRLQTGSSDYYEQNLFILRKMAAFCKQHKARMVLVSFPMWHTFNEEMNKDHLKMMYEGIGKLKDEFGLTYMDYREDKRFEEEDFSDIQHLSLKGSEKFTKILKKDINIVPL